MKGERFLEEVGAELDSTVELLRALVELESPSTEKVLVDRLGAFMVDRLRFLGLEPKVLRRDRAGDLLWTEIPGSGEGRTLFLCHLDTVWPEGSLALNPFRIQDDRLYGPGIYDMKGGVAATLKIQEWASRDRLRPKRTLRFLYTTDEETGSHFSREVIEEFARQSDQVLILEPPLKGGALKTFRKGVGDFVIRTHGRAAHAGVEPEKGINAVEEMARQVLVLHSLSAPEMGSGVAVTVFRGGTRENVIPAQAEARVDVRFQTPEEGERLEKAIFGLKPHLPGARLEVEGGINRPPMIRTEATRRLFRSAREIADGLGQRLEEGETGGGSDGSYTAALGIPTLDGLGFDGDGAHALHEHLLISSIPERLALLLRLAERL